MGFNVLVHPGLNQEAMFARGSATKGSTTNRNTRGEERLEERARIARELHDTLLQGFFSVSLQLQTMVNNLPADSTSKPRFTDLMLLMNRVLEQGRLMVQGLRSPQERQFFSLAEALAGVPRELGLSSDIRFRVLVEGLPKELRASLADEVYGIGREAIFNAFRHSQATQVEAKIEYRASGFRLSVRDNGCGIDPQHLRWGRNGHWGLQGMRERAERIGARLRILSRAALGTEVELWVPARIALVQDEISAVS